MQTVKTKLIIMSQKVAGITATPHNKTDNKANNRISIDASLVEESTSQNTRKKKKRKRAMSQKLELDLDMESDDAVSQTRFSGMLSTDSDKEVFSNTEKSNRHSEVIESRKTYRL